ncbi:MAG TPA: NAD-dependent succinate-semialdehyde dehydrogenase [Gammaproteobacteria bacterium]|nr:NAD-dependent succinate-semialdehyde dehydrogenase [Gammaproteobacteria bacterium]
MAFTSINPANGRLLRRIEEWDAKRLEMTLQQAASAAPVWSSASISERSRLFAKLAGLLRQRQDELARLITEEMGKLIKEARAEIEKCALACDHYAEHGAAFLADEIIPSDAGKSYINYQPLGTVLAIMPWNFPFWQAFRCAIPALLAGNTVLLKLASNVMQCALAIEQLFREAGFPPDVFVTLLIGSEQTQRLIADPRVQAVSLTGSVEAGRQVAASAGQHLKKTVLELGGSDAFIVLDDADLAYTVEQARIARFQNAGQSCIAAKRFIVLDSIADEFVERFKWEIEQKLLAGDPLHEATTLAPLARADLRDSLHRQVTDSIAQGAQPITGCVPLEGPGNYYTPSLLNHVKPGMRAYHEELFGPVASIIQVRDEQEAVHVANATSFGLGGSVWTRDSERGERLARKLACGLAFVNGIVKSDPRLPFGGVKDSGYGRELAYLGMREFVNIQTVWIK